MNHLFSMIAQWVSRQSGKSYTFIAACCLIVLWGITGPLFHYSDTWQLIINTGTTIITFLMVFLLQNSQTRDSAAIQVKLDELIRVNLKARNTLIDIESNSDEEIAAMRKDIVTEK